MDSKLTALTAAGTSICGVTAITALAPAIDAEQKHVAMSVASVVAFGTCGMLTYPYIAHNFLDSSEQVGLFLGLAIHDTAQVVGASMTYNELFHDELAMRIAVVTKLTRNIFLAGVIPYLAFSTVGGEGSNGARPALTWAGFKQHLPLFVVGFLGMACARSVGDWSLAATGMAYGSSPVPPILI